MKNLKGKNCLLTGAASGIGRSLAILLAQEGMNICIVDIDADNLENVRKEVEDLGAKVYSRKCDISKLDEIQKIADEFYQELGDVDLLINNAGVAGGGFIVDISLEEWKRVLDVNLWSIIYAVKVFLPKMLERGSGHFVNTGSGAGIIGLPYHIHYVASKFAVVGLTEALYSELHDSGVNFSVICPTRVKTNMARSSPIKIDPRLYSITDKDEIERKSEEFKDIFSEKFYDGGVDPDDAAKRYLKGIKKNRLYIFDVKILRAANFIKAVALKHGWKGILKKQQVDDYLTMETSLIEAGLTTKEHLDKELGH